MEKCYRYKEIIKSNELEEIRNHPTKNREDTGYTAEIKKLVKETERKIKGKTVKEFDKILYKDFHNTFKHLPFELTNDIRFWNYLGMNDFLFLLEKRWVDSDKKRYIGRQTKEGISRHGVSKLFLNGDQRFKTAQHKMNDIMLERQDTYAQLTERDLSMSSEISESLIKNLKTKNLDQDEFRATIVKIGRTGGTKLIYAMDEKNVMNIIK